jgi:hypothetical protein
LGRKELFENIYRTKHLHPDNIGAKQGRIIVDKSHQVVGNISFLELPHYCAPDFPCPIDKGPGQTIGMDNMLPVRKTTIQFTDAHNEKEGRTIHDQKEGNPTRRERIEKGDGQSPYT